MKRVSKGPGKLLGALGLARRAGALAAGQDEVCRQAQRGAAAAVFLTDDVAERTRKRVKTACADGCPVVEMRLTQADMTGVAGKPTGVLAVTNRDLAVLALKAANEEEPD